MASRQNLAMSAVAGLLCISAMLNNAQASASIKQCGGFAESCRAPFSHSGGFLSASCADEQGHFRQSSVDLNPHLGNDDGNLVQGSGYIESCTPAGYADFGGTTFLVIATCKKIDGSTDSTSYNVNNNVVNNNGQLVWNNCAFNVLESTPLNAAADNLVIESIVGRKLLNP